MKDDNKVNSIIEYYINGKCQCVNIELTNIQHILLADALDIASKMPNVDIELLRADGIKEL